MTTMAKKIAGIIDPQAWYHEGLKEDTDRFAGRRDISLRKARAALTALLEPSEEMVAATHQEVADLFRANVPEPLAEGRAHRAIISAIQAALDEKEGQDVVR